jgi:hypothetical protein
VLRAQGDGGGAERVLREADGIFRAALGDDHPALTVCEHLSDCASDRGDHEEAGRLRREADRIRRLL